MIIAQKFYFANFCTFFSDYMAADDTGVTVISSAIGGEFGTLDGLYTLMVLIGKPRSSRPICKDNADKVKSQIAQIEGAID